MTREFLGAKHPADALQAMVDGLREADTWEGYRVYTGSFGGFCGEVCYGCAATAALQKLSGVRFSTKTIRTPEARASALGVRGHTLLCFEYAVEDARLGYLGTLYNFFRMTVNYEFDSRFQLQDHNWRNELPKVEAVIAEMRKETKEQD